MMKCAAVPLLALALCSAAGCSSKLDTGYEPVKLGTLSPAQRRGLYAEDYSLEARAAQEDKHDNSDVSNTKSPGQP